MAALAVTNVLARVSFLLVTIVRILMQVERREFALEPWHGKNHRSTASLTVQLVRQQRFQLSELAQRCATQYFT